MAVDDGADALAGDRVELRRVDEVEAAVAGAGDDRLGERMLGGLLGGRDQAEQLVLVDAGRR